MKFYATVLILLSGLTELSGQNISSVNADSLKSYLKEVEKDNKRISDAYNQMGQCLKKENEDSLKAAVTMCSGIVADIYEKYAKREIPAGIHSLNTAYTDWIGELRNFNLEKLGSLLQFYNSKRLLLLSDKEADTSYVDRQISNFFKEMDDEQSDLREAYYNELARIE